MARPENCIDNAAITADLGMSLGDPLPALLHQRYRRDRKLGRGGMGVVYRYYDEKLDRFLAVKTLTAEYASNQQWRERFLREAKTLASLAHHNIGALYDLVECDGAAFLLLEFVPGRTLAEELSGKPLPIDRALSIALQVGQAIEAGHAAGIIHGDIKPGNIMVTPGDVAKLLDYGLAQQRNLETGESAGVSRSANVDTADISALILAQHGAGAGTPGYMSPEQIYGGNVGRASDVWAWGCVLFECLTGQPTFAGATRQERLTATLNSAPAYQNLPANVPDEVVDLLQRCLHKDPDQRARHIGEIIAELRQAVQTPSQSRATFTPPNNIPEPLSSFVDRSGEMDALSRLFSSNRLVTLTGPGGCGKTRLATEFARNLLQRKSKPDQQFVGGVWMIELAPLSSGELIARTVAAVMCRSQATTSADRPPMQLLIETIGLQPTVILLDNCEHLVEPCAGVIRELLGRCPNLRIIATSRAGLGVKGEQIYHVPALSFPEPERFGSTSNADALQFEAVRLFAERAKLARPDFAVTGENGAVIGDICHKLEGIPLAIELAAARVRAMPIDQIGARLFEVLDPQRVLESSIKWSVQLLTAAERALLARLSVFRGGWTLEAAEAVCGDGETKKIRKKPVVDLLGSLVDKSLVLYEERDARPRYHMLETVREFALNNGESIRSVREQHLKYFVNISEQANDNFSGPEQGRWLDRLESERDNLRLAVDSSLILGVDSECSARLCRNLHMFWCLRGDANEAERLIVMAITKRGSLQDALTVQLQNAASIVAARMRKWNEAKRHALCGLTLARELNDFPRTAGLLTNCGLWNRQSGDLKESLRCHEEAIEVYSKIGDGIGVAMARLNLAGTLKLMGDLESSHTLLMQCLPNLEATGDAQRIALALCHLSEICTKQGNTHNARDYLLKCLKICHDLRDKRLGGSACLSYITYLQAQGRISRAVELAQCLQSLVNRQEVIIDAGELGGCVRILDSHSKQAQSLSDSGITCESVVNLIDLVIDEITSLS